MAKPIKSQNPEFLEKRRRAIVELAKRRRQVTSSAARLDPSRKVAKVIGPVSFAVRPQPQN